MGRVSSTRADRHAIWLPQHRLGYFRVPKAANSSIRYLLANSFNMPRIKGLSPAMDEYWNLLDNAQASCMTTQRFHKRDLGREGWSFSFVRHPVSRLYSCWNNKVIENTNMASGFLDMGITLGMNFDSFVGRIADSPDTVCDIHVRSQAAILTDNGHMVPDFVGRVETMKADWAHVRYEINMRCGIDPGDILEKNVRKRIAPEIANSLSSRTLDLIHDRYRADFDLFYPD